MSWLANLADINAAVLDPAAFGEPVTLPDGTEAVGIFDPQGAPALAPWPEVGNAAPVSAQPNPTVTLPTADAATLRIGATLVIRGTAYVVAAKPKDTGEGLAKVALMPATASGGGFQLSRYA